MARKEQQDDASPCHSSAQTLGSHFLISQYKSFQIAPICKYINIIILHKNLDPSVTHWDDKKRVLG
ncbi:hypothetical protein [Wolbachia endosymbiont (group A) of Anomoia purmunda]|uniref:hypothetical protein n=1 Tax=Wolbachia endosymbiont (group A) of Anomoia purmunda TaxID=2953978 RepID=UPI00223098FA|nr:hypothetical protein [Wolbachia endosymbiont (group A) of Anomoia purmunda]